MASVCGIKYDGEAVEGKGKVSDRHHGTNTEQSRYDIMYILPDLPCGTPEAHVSMDKNGNL